MPRQTALLVVAFFALLALACADQAQEQTPAMEEPEQAATQDEITLMATLSGAAEVPGPGDADGSGTAHATLKPAQGEVCFEISVSNIGEATAAHIHTGAAGQSGGPVVDLEVATHGLNGCVSGVTDEVIAQIRENPSAYYVNVHNAEFGGGAVRGQLAAM